MPPPLSKTPDYFGLIHADGCNYNCVFAETHRVHFDENSDLVGKDNEITVHQKIDKLDVHLGFLQVKHRYSISFSVPRTLTADGSGEVVLEDTTSNPHLEIISATGSQETVDFQLELLAYKEKLLLEEFCFRLSDVKTPFTVILNARVLGKGKGTPLLKNGIHSIYEPSYTNDSDTSSD